MEQAHTKAVKTTTTLIPSCLKTFREINRITSRVVEEEAIMGRILTKITWVTRTGTDSLSIIMKMIGTFNFSIFQSIILE